MAEFPPIHGGTDAGPEPLWDFSTNTNALGPCPAVLRDVQAADLTRYPDPAYTALRAMLAAHHTTLPEHIAVGAGASELILRLVRAVPGPVLVLGPTFSEYARCARMEGRVVVAAESPSAFLAMQCPEVLGFLCWPNNPTGEAWPAGFVAEAARRGPLVVDLAYAPLCPEGVIDTAAATQAVRLYAPNKALGLTGLRAAYAVTPDGWPALDVLAPSWVIGPAGVAFLRGSVGEAAQDWLPACRPVLAAWRRELAEGLAARGLAVRESPANFLLVRVGDAGAAARRLRAQGLRVRDGTSFGLPEWLRLAAAPPEWRAALLAALDGAEVER
jgi:histidinol-phosphate aminotransferase